jgi:apolipoprotein N-acyltransferase
MAVIAAFVLAFPPFTTFGLGGFLAFGLLFAFLTSASRRDTLLVGFAIGASKVFCLLYWAFIELPHPWMSLVIAAGVNGACWCAACVIMARLLRTKSLWWTSIAVIPAVELILALPMVNLCQYCCIPHTVAANSILLQLVSLIGYLGLSVSIVGVSALGTLGFIHRRWPLVAASVGAIVAWIAFGTGRSAVLNANVARTKELRIAFVQLYHPKNYPDDYLNKGIVRERLREVLRGDDTIDLLILPEEVLYESSSGAPSTSLSLNELDQLLVQMGRQGLVVVAGIETSVADDGSLFRNSVVCFTAGRRKVAAQYVDKQHPAIIGEGRVIESFKWLRDVERAMFGDNGTLVTSRPRTAVQIGDFKAGIRICNEHLAPHIVPATDLVHVSFLLVLADTRWFDYSRVERSQSRAGRQLLAAQYGVPVLYVANGGSEIVEPNGHVQVSLNATAHGGVWSLRTP